MSRTIALLAVALCAAGAAAQQQPPPAPKPAPKTVRTGQTVEIRGQAPTPQVVTVRPREVPQYKASSLPQAVMTSGSWPAISTAYAVTPPLLIAGHLPIDTTPAGLARGGASAGAVAGAAAAGAAGGAAGAPAVGTSSAEIEAMRHDMATRQARLDSLERSMKENQTRQTALGAAPAAAGGARMSAADSAARVAEIMAIRKELNYRKARLDSLQKEVNSIGTTKKKKSSTKSDTTKSGKPPRGT